MVSSELFTWRDAHTQGSLGNWGESWRIRDFAQVRDDASPDGEESFPSHKSHRFTSHTHKHPAAAATAGQP